MAPSLTRVWRQLRNWAPPPSSLLQPPREGSMACPLQCGRHRRSDSPAGAHLGNPVGTFRALNISNRSPVGEVSQVQFCGTEGRHLSFPTFFSAGSALNRPTKPKIGSAGASQRTVSGTRNHNVSCRISVTWNKGKDVTAPGRAQGCGQRFQ